MIAEVPSAPPAAQTISLMIVDDHPLVREGLSALLTLQSDMRVVAQASDGAEAIPLYRCHRPDVVLMDYRMPGMDGLEALEAIRQEFADARIILLTMYDGDEDIYRALQAGARSYVLKNAPRDEVLSIIRAVHRGVIPLPDDVAQKLAERTIRPDLTTRERDVLHLIVAGKSNTEIAAILGIAEGTVKSHVNSLLSKMDVSDRTQAGMLALKRGLARLA